MCCVHRSHGLWWREDGGKGRKSEEPHGASVPPARGAPCSGGTGTRGPNPTRCWGSRLGAYTHPEPAASVFIYSQLGCFSVSWKKIRPPPLCPEIRRFWAASRLRELARRGHGAGRNNSPEAPGAASRTFTEMRKFEGNLQAPPFLRSPALSSLLGPAVLFAALRTPHNGPAAVTELQLIPKAAPKTPFVAKKGKEEHGAIAAQALVPDTRGARPPPACGAHPSGLLGEGGPQKAQGGPGGPWGRGGGSRHHTVEVTLRSGCGAGCGGRPAYQEPRGRQPGSRVLPGTGIAGSDKAAWAQVLRPGPVLRGPFPSWLSPCTVAARFSARRKFGVGAWTLSRAGGGFVLEPERRARGCRRRKGLCAEVTVSLSHSPGRARGSSKERKAGPAEPGSTGHLRGPRGCGDVAQILLPGHKAKPPPQGPVRDLNARFLPLCDFICCR